MTDMQAYPKDGGDPISKGQRIVSFKGEVAYFVAVTREPQGNSEGRIATIRASKAWLADAPAPTFEELMDDNARPWPERLSWYQEFYPSVYELVIR
jgi:hypothetical protein